MYLKGDRVKHPKMSDWGIGQVLENIAPNKVKVFFVNAGEKTLDINYVNLVKVEGAKASHPLLDNPIAKPKKGTTDKQYISLPDAKKDFIIMFPNGFKDEGYKQIERDYKYEAHNLLTTILSEQVITKLLKSKDYEEVCKRALQVVNKTNLIFPNEKMDLKDGLELLKNKKWFSETLFNLLYQEGDIEQRFMAFADCLLAIGAAKWTIATYFLFLRYPDEHMFLKPAVTKKAADLSAFELNYKPELNWLTYHTLLKFAAYLRTELTKLGLKPRDMIDVQSFMWCIAPKL